MRHLAALAVFTASVVFSGTTLRAESPEGQAMKRQLFGMFGTIMSAAQCQMLRDMARKSGQAEPDCTMQNGGGYGFGGGAPAPPPPRLPPDPSDGQGYVKVR